MPRNRRPQDREVKRAEIVTAAAELFSDLGFEQTSMGRIAAAAGVTTTTIYWYVADKDALLVAALDHLVADGLRDLESQAGAPLVEQVLWTLGRLKQHRRLISVVHTRSEQSPVVATWHDAFHATLDAMVVDGLARQGVPEQDHAGLARLTTYAVEGLLAHPGDPAGDRAVLELVLR